MVRPTIENRVHPNATIHADEAASWDRSQVFYSTKRINHEECYSKGDPGTNQAESFFARLRRAGIGIHHHIAGPCLNAYASEMAWREDNRRVGSGEQYLMTAGAGSYPSRVSAVERLSATCQ